MEEILNDPGRPYAENVLSPYPAHRRGNGAPVADARRDARPIEEAAGAIFTALSRVPEIMRGLSA